MTTVFINNIVAVVKSDPKLSAQLADAFVKLSGPLGEVTLSDVRGRSRIVLYDGTCNEEELKDIRLRLFPATKNGRAAKYQLSITRGKYGGSYGKYAPMRTALEYVSMQRR